MQTQIEDEQRQREEAREAYNAAERRATILTGEIEELRSALEQVTLLLSTQSRLRITQIIHRSSNQI